MPVWSIDRTAARGPVADGENVTSTCSAAPGSRSSGTMSAVASNIGPSGPVTVADRTSIVPPAASLRRSTVWVTASPSGVAGKATAAGVAVRGAVPGSRATAEPDSGTSSVPPLELSTRRLATWSPAAVGA